MINQPYKDLNEAMNTIFLSQSAQKWQEKMLGIIINQA